MGEKEFYWYSLLTTRSEVFESVLELQNEEIPKNINTKSH